MHDIIIVGGGPAGLTAAIYALRAEKTVLLLEKNGFGGQIALSPKVDNFPGCPGISGAELADTMLTQVMNAGGDVDLCEVMGIEDRGEYRSVHTSDGDLEARAVIIASGAKHRLLGVEREDELTGHGVSYCAVCDGAFYKDRLVAVAGGGNAALQEALVLSNTCSTVYVIHRRDKFRAEAANVKAAEKRANIRFVMNCSVVGLSGKDELNGVILENHLDGSRKILPLDGLFVAIGFESENAPFADVVRLDGSGWFDADESCSTLTPGVFVAGDCRRKSVRQLTTAVSDGAVAALAACRYIDSI